MGDFVYLKKSRYSLPPGQNLLKACDYTTMVTANRMLEDAEERAQHIVARANRVYVAEKERGYQDGVAEGKRSLADQVLETVIRTVDFLGAMETQVVETVMRAGGARVCRKGFGSGGPSPLGGGGRHLG